MIPGQEHRVRDRCQGRRRHHGDPEARRHPRQGDGLEPRGAEPARQALEPRCPDAEAPERSEKGTTERCPEKEELDARADVARDEDRGERQSGRSEIAGEVCARADDEQVARHRHRDPQLLHHEEPHETDDRQTVHPPESTAPPWAAECGEPRSIGRFEPSQDCGGPICCWMSINGCWLTWTSPSSGRSRSTTRVSTAPSAMTRTTAVKRLRRFVRPAP